MADYDRQSGRAVPPEPELTGAEREVEEQDVAAALGGLAGLLTDVENVEDVLGEIAAYAKASIPGADGVGVTLVQTGGAGQPLLAWSVTDPFVREVDHLQYDVCREGPCLTAMQNRRALIAGSLGSDQRWPRFGGRVARLRVHSTLALPLLVRDMVVGAINVYARERDAFSEHAADLGERFAGPAAISVHNIRMLHAARDQAAQLQTALTSRTVIDQAIGIVRSRSGVSAEEAFNRLRRISQAKNVKLRVVAATIVEEAVRRVHARSSGEGSRD